VAGEGIGETVLDVPAKLAARVRVFDTGNARKTDATDAHAVVMVAPRTPTLTWTGTAPLDASSRNRTGTGCLGPGTAG